MQKNKGLWKKVVAGVAVAGVAIALSACSSNGGGGNGGGTGTLDGKGALLKVFMPSTSNVYLAAAAQAAKDEAAALGFKISIVENNWDATEQAQQVQEWLATKEKAAAVLFWPTSAANATASIRDLSKVAPILQWNQLIDPAADSYIKIGYAGVSDLGIGDQAGKDTLAQIDKLTAAGYKFKGGAMPNVLEISLGSGDYAAGVDRDKAFQAVTKGKINLLGVEGAKEFDAQGAYKAASTAIPKYLSKGIDIIYVQTNDMGNGVVQAAEQNGLKPGKDVFLMTGTSSGSMANLKSGKITTAVLQSPQIEGTLIVDVADQYLATGKSTGTTPITIASDPAKPKLEMVSPNRITYMMNPTVTAANIGSFKIWGWDFFQLMGKAAVN
jgi:ribose transport system substrate-binding protein